MIAGIVIGYLLGVCTVLFVWSTRPSPEPDEPEPVAPAFKFTSAMLIPFEPPDELVDRLRAYLIDGHRSGGKRSGDVHLHWRGTYNGDTHEYGDDVFELEVKGWHAGSS